MKNRLNILCVLAILILCCSVFSNLYDVCVSFKAGFDAAGRHNTEELEKITNMHAITLMPDNMALLTDSVFNSQTNSFVPASYSQLIVSVKAPSSIWQSAIKLISSLGYFVVIVVAIVFFLLMIISVNKSDIFIWKNVRRLRIIGVLLIVSFIFNLLPVLITNNTLTDVLTVKGYHFTVMEHVSVTTAVVGVVSLIIAEVFAIGLRMKEEQELTI